MIYDLGCLSQPDLAGRVFRAMPGALAVLAVIAGLALIGMIPQRDRRFLAQDIFTGWGIAATVMTMATVISTSALPFATLALLLLIAARAVPALKRRYFSAPFWLLALFPGLFVIVAINVAGVAKWDDFSHWVPNALYLFHFDSVPALSLPPPRSAWPGYPYALPFLTYMASWLAGGFVMQGGAMINFLMLAAFASMLTEKLSPPTDTHSLNLASVGKMALALVLVTLANPGFNASFSITNQADTPTMVLIGALALMLWQTINRLRDKDRDGADDLRLPLILTGLALIFIKQSNLALFGLLLIGFLIAATKNGVLKPALTQALRMFLSAFVLRFVWQTDVDTQMATGRIFHMRGLSEWRFDLAPSILHAMLQAMIKANGLSLMMLGITVYGGISVFRPPTPRRSFAIMAGTAYAGYLAFLLTTYIGASFEENEAQRATSFFRYCTHTSLLGITFLWMIAPSLWTQLKIKTRTPILPMLAKGGTFMTARPAGVFLLTAFLPIAYIVHGEWLVPKPSSEICAVRNLGHKLAETLSDHTKLAVIEPESEGLFTYIVDFEFGLEEARTGRDIRITQHADRGQKNFDPTQLQLYLKQYSDMGATTVLVPQAEHEPVSIAGESNARGPLILLRDGTGWKRLPLE